MIRFFRRKRPTPPPERMSVLDAIIASRAGYNEQQWRALTNQERANIRWRAGIFD